MPQIEELRGLPLPDGRFNVQWTATDRQLDPNSLRIEVQDDVSNEWRPLNVTSAVPTVDGVLVGQTVWTPPSGSRPVAVRATVSDLAGNPAFFQTEAGASPPRPIARAPMPTLTAEPGNLPSTPYPHTGVWNNELSNPFGPPSDFGRERDELVPAAPPLAALPTPSGWTAPTASPADPYAVSQPPSQPWSADVKAPVPFRLANSGQTFDSGSANSVTTYGNPVGTGDRFASSATDRYAQNEAPGLVPVDAPGPQAVEQPARNSAAGPGFKALEPFRQASISHPAAISQDYEPEEVSPAKSGAGLGSTELAEVSTLDSRLGWPSESPSLLDRWDVKVPRGVEPKFVNSRTFSLEYQVDDVGGWGVSKVQLWGTRDGGQTWHYYAEDDDNRSPLSVTVDGEGLYGFRIVVQSAAGPGGFAPQSGDLPELWVGVDLHRPQAELLSVEPGAGNLSDHLVLRWRADDDNLEPRPISLFYSSRPTGPWSAAATGLQNSGEYAWRLERYVPTQFYLRLEVRDTAGNLAAYQTVEPIRLDRPEPTGSLRAVEPVDPTASTPTMSPR
jgi:hypothetical protein